MKSYTIARFPQYVIKQRKLFRKAHKTKSKSCKWQYREEREVKQTVKDKKAGYWLVSNNKRKFVSCDNLRKIVKEIK